MKHLKIPFLLFVVSFFLQGCFKDNCERELTYLRFDPIFMSIDEIREPVAQMSPQTLERPGKIYFFNDYILINEQTKGIHIIDNADPSNPNNVSFLKIPGNLDMTIRDDKMYVDNAMDMLVLDVSDMSSISTVSRTQDAFTNDFVEGKGVIIGYTSEEVTETFECQDGRVMEWNDFSTPMELGGGSFGAMDVSNASGRIPGNSVGGSTTRFTTVGDYLYTVDFEELRVFDVSNSANPSLVNTEYIGFGVETIFPYKDHLFMGSVNGVYIYRISNPAFPQFAEMFVHATGCDPVIVKDDIAYVTIHSGSDCNGLINQIDIIDVENIGNGQTRLIQSISMENPKGLSIANDHLFLCDNGLKVYDIADDPTDLGTPVTVNRSANPTDVIALSGGLVMVIGENGLTQFDAADPSNIIELSTITVNP